jgi:cysteine desulfuration protein SufE
MAGMSILQEQARMVDEFQSLPSWEDRYKRIIAMAKDLAPMPDELKTDANKVRGCSSTVWLHASSDGRVVTYVADSDAILVRGLVALLLAIYSGRTPDEILGAPPDFLEEMGLNANLSPNRASGLTAMVKQIRIYALAFKSQQDRGA